MRRICAAGTVFVFLFVTSFLLLGGHQRPQTTTSGYIGNDVLVEDGLVHVEPPDPAIEPQEKLGLVEGTVVDNLGLPVRGIEVELISTDQSTDKTPQSEMRDWTDPAGKYKFDRVEAGEYLIAVLKRGAPDGRHPFAGSYYPGTEDQTRAAHLLVTHNSPIELPSIQLRRLDTVTLKVRIAFEDGGIPDWSNLLFHNLSFPDQAVIGDEAPGVENGEGEITLPQGFEYYAQAKVDCDAGPKIETRESRPIQQLRIEGGHIPEELVFTIPGPSCKLWSPR